jgi:hypothetical protein
VYYTARTRPNDTTTFINVAAGDIKLVPMPASLIPNKQANGVMTAAGRLGMILLLDTLTKKVPYRVYQFTGSGFDVPENQWVVTHFTSEAARGGADANLLRYQIQFPNPTDIAEFNCHLQVPQFEKMALQQFNSITLSTGYACTHFNLDYQNRPLSGKSMYLNGTEKSSQVQNGNGDTTSVVSHVNAPYHNPNWPQSLYVNRTQSTLSRSIASNRARISDTTYYFNYNDTNGLPRFTLRNSGPEKILLSQSIFDPLGFPKQSITYRLFSQPNTQALDTADANTVFSNTGAIASSKSVFKGFDFVEDSVWREQDAALTDVDLRAGTTPNFKLNEGWLPSGKITLRDSSNFYQVQESKSSKSKAPGALGEIYTSAFYEGLRSDPVAVVSNAKWANCAVLLAENGNAGLLPSYLDWPRRWINNGATFTSGRSHTGRYSLKVVDNKGPQIDLYLQDVRSMGFGFKVSAWIYYDTIAPVLTIERHASTGALLDTVCGKPVGGVAPAAKTWQRWEVSLTNNQLINNLFQGSNDYLRIWAGTGPPSGNPIKVTHVDDLVCLPTNASFSLATFDRRGVGTSATNAAHQVVHYDINFKGQTTAARDEAYRIFGQSAGHAMGEN